MAGFTIDATAAEALMLELAHAKLLLVAEVHKETMASGKAIQATARSLSKSRSMPGLSGSIWTKTKKYANGTEVTVEAKSPFGSIREFGAGRSGPHPFMLPALMSELPNWEAKLAAATSRALR